MSDPEAIEEPPKNLALEAVSAALTSYNCRIEGMLILNESIVKGVPEVKALPKMGESEPEASKRVEQCKTELDGIMEEHKKAWRITAAVLNGPARIQIDMVDVESADLVLEEEPVAEKQEKKAKHKPAGKAPSA